MRARPESTPNYFDKLRAWQSNDGSLSMIGPHFRLSRDYDQFLVWIAGFLIAVLSVQFRTLAESREYFADMLFGIVQKTGADWRLPNLIWLYHLTNQSPGSHVGLFAEQELSRLGALTLELLLDPPPGTIDDPDWEERVEIARASNSATRSANLRSECRARLRVAPEVDSSLCAARLLLSDGPPDLSIPGLLRLLYEDLGLTR